MNISTTATLAACACVLTVLTLTAGGCGSSASYTPEQAARAKTSIETVQTRDLTPGVGEVAAPGTRVVVHYTGWLYDSAATNRRGVSFDSSRKAGRPFDFVLGGGQVIDGWERGIAGMKEGGVRELVIPSRLAYGADGSGGVIPPDATLVFEIELVDVR